MTSSRSLRGLDLLNFFTANIQTGFGPFIASYLTIHKWTGAEIGAALSLGTFTAMLSQLPAGAILDRTLRKRAAAAAAILAIAGCALMLGVWPQRLPVLAAEVLHGFASCVMPPAVAAISLALVGQAALGERLGRNARWGAIGNGAAAALMGACGQYVSVRSVFWLTAALALPAVGALLAIEPGRARSAPAVARPAARAGGAWTGGAWALLDRKLVAFAACAVLFQLANAALLPLAAAGITEHAAGASQLIIAGAIVVPQLVVAGISPWMGRLARHRGRRLVLLIGFAALPLRALALALLPAPSLLLPLQALDGISAAMFGVMLPLIAADLSGDGGEGFNLRIGALGLASGIGGTLSTLAAGMVADAYGTRGAFLGLAATGLLGWLLVLLAMPETRPPEPTAPSPRA